MFSKGLKNNYILQPYTLVKMSACGLRFLFLLHKDPLDLLLVGVTGHETITN